MSATMSRSSRMMDLAPAPSWTREIWHRLEKAIHEEADSIGITRRIMPVRKVSPEALTVPANAILQRADTFSIDEAPITPLNEIWGELALTPQQTEDEGELETAVVLGRHVANFLAEAVDGLIFQGEAAIHRDPRFVENRVQVRSGPAGRGLLDHAPEDQVVRVEASSDGPAIYGDRTFEAVARGYRLLQSQGHDGPYALVLSPEPYADAFAPLPRTQLMPAERMNRLLDTRLLGSGTLAPATGVLVSVGGSTLELVVGRHTQLSFLQNEADGLSRFRVLERFALRVQDPTAIVKLIFQQGASS